MLNDAEYQNKQSIKSQFITRLIYNTLLTPNLGNGLKNKSFLSFL